MTSAAAATPAWCSMPRGFLMHPCAAMPAQLQAVRDYKRNTTPIGLPPKAPQAEGAVDEEDEDMTEEEEEEVCVML